MTSLQPLFRRFHEAIQRKRSHEDAELREKRDRILKRLRENVSTTFEPFNQGSYEMGTGVKPLNGDYDIDVGIRFNIDYRSHDPVEVKGWVYKAVQEHTARVEWRHPCITVYYQESRQVIYHVDLAVFAKDTAASKLRLALGKEHSAADQKQWKEDDRLGFMEDLERRFSGENAAQLRRVIRYLKRWKDLHFPKEGRAAPSGLALTVAAYCYFQPKAVQRNGQEEYDDRAATATLVEGMLGRFRQIPDNGRYVPRLSLQFPRAPRDDVFARMSNQQMVELNGRLTQLHEWLKEAQNKGSTAPLRRAFGDAFPEK